MQNHGVTILLDENKNVDLMEILQVIGEMGINSNWKISGVECFGEPAEILHDFSDNEKDISGKEFYNFVSNIYQTLDGQFEAFNGNENTHWLLVHATRGEAFDIETDNKEILDKIQISFQNVRDLIY